MLHVVNCIQSMSVLTALTIAHLRRHPRPKNNFMIDINMCEKFVFFSKGKASSKNFWKKIKIGVLY